MESLLKDGFSSDAMAPPLIAIIGGSALGDAFELEEEQAKFLVTPHGAPSDPPRVGRHAGVPVAFLPRHGKDHRIPPHKLNHRANLWALKEVGASHIIGTSSTGSSIRLPPSTQPCGGPSSRPRRNPARPSRTEDRTCKRPGRASRRARKSRSSRKSGTS